MVTTPKALACLAEDGYAIIAGFLSAQQVSLWRSAVAASLLDEPPAVGRTGPYFLWPELSSGTSPFRALYQDSGIEYCVNRLLRSDLRLEPPEHAQLAITLPPHPRHPGAPHIDGLTPPEADGRPGTFTVLAGLLLTDQQQPSRGNLWVWPGSHHGAAEWLRQTGPDALRDAVPYPPIELGEPRQVTAPAGSLVLVHYLLAHNIGGHFGTAADERRETVYFRLRAEGHRANWREALLAPLSEFAIPEL
ncbi:phytanoyl-CoA dioxygenase family protein [Streptacidiphilus sp. MAP5-52]|uniref:phytanoyl-CoA dioxygenase family protein n=1 Tax=Streptacidiphilus sp. MAP5-52 TaxID=3156267 RepID=UPI0035164538